VISNDVQAALSAAALGGNDRTIRQYMALEVRQAAPAVARQRRADFAEARHGDPARRELI
jgi:hypothetical protein